MKSNGKLAVMTFGLVMGLTGTVGTAPALANHGGEHEPKSAQPTTPPGPDELHRSSESYTPKTGATNQFIKNGPIRRFERSGRGEGEEPPPPPPPEEGEPPMTKD